MKKQTLKEKLGKLRIMSSTPNLLDKVLNEIVDNLGGGNDPDLVKLCNLILYGQDDEPGPEKPIEYLEVGLRKDSTATDVNIWNVYGGASDVLHEAMQNHKTLSLKINDTEYKNIKFSMMFGQLTYITGNPSTDPIIDPILTKGKEYDSGAAYLLLPDGVNVTYFGIAVMN